MDNSGVGSYTDQTSPSMTTADTGSKSSILNMLERIAEKKFKNIL